MEAVKAVQNHSPVILLLGTCETDKVDRWLEGCPYSTREVNDPFQALEQMSDFTVRDRPDVIFLHVDSISAERAFMQAIVASDEGDIRIIGYDIDETSDVASLDALATRLTQLIPSQSVM